jgi:hypothetical protein
MRIGALLLVGICLLSAAACTVNTSSDEVCISAGGACFASNDLAGCAEQLSGAVCDQGYTCCTAAPTSTSTDAGTAYPGTPATDAAVVKTTDGSAG